ncbi:hypothetical protein AB0904_24885 [Streptomyces sp. NPDC006684]|uniref:hypothetical protein n=1 Tax=Streptomyces sp. NPDC006684 TaxID=3154477 RepID=UPI0034535339
MTARPHTYPSSTGKPPLAWSRGAIGSPAQSLPFGAALDADVPGEGYDVIVRAEATTMDARMVVAQVQQVEALEGVVREFGFWLRFCGP